MNRQKSFIHVWTDHVDEDIARRFQPERQLEYLYQPIWQLEREGRYPEAIALAIEANDSIYYAYGNWNPIFASSLQQLTAVYYRAGDYVAAEPLIRRAMEVGRRTVGENHPEFARSLGGLALLYQATGDYAAAETAAVEAVEILRTSAGESHPYFAEILEVLATTKRFRGDFSTAELLGLKVTELRRATLGEDHPAFAGSLGNLAEVYREMGNYAAAEPLCQKMVELLRTSVGEAHPDFARALSMLAAVYVEVGNYPAAEPLYRKAAEIRRVALGEVHPDFALALTGLAFLYREMGDYAAAEPLYLRASEIYSASLGMGQPALGKCLLDLAMLYSYRGDHPAAEPLYRQAVDVLRASLGETHPDFARSLLGLGSIHFAKGEYVPAEFLLRQVLEIMRTTLGEDHPDYAVVLCNLASSHQELGNSAAAEPLYCQALEILRTSLGESHPLYANFLNSLAFLFAATGRASEAIRLMEQASAIDDRMIGQIFAIGSERQRIAYLSTVQWHLYAYLSLVLQYLSESPVAVRAALDLVLRRKAITAEAMAAQRDAVLGGKYPVLEPLLRELAVFRMQIARKTLAGPGPEGLEPHARRLAEWNATKERLEAELARQIPEMNLEQKLRTVDRRAVAMNLFEGVAQVEFVRFPVRDFQAVPARGESRGKPARYVAFILASSAPDDVQMIDLGEAEPIDRLIADFRTVITAEAETKDGRDVEKLRHATPPTTERDAGLALRAALFDRLAPALGSRSRLLIAPDGDLTRLPFEALPTEHGRRLIDDYQISYLSCGRDVLRFGATVTGGPGSPLVVADPDFDLEATIPTRSVPARRGSWSRLYRETLFPNGPVPARPTFWSRLLGRGKTGIKTRMPAVPTPETTARSAGRHSRDLDRDRGVYHFHRLPETRAEGEGIAAKLNISPWLDAAAMEGRLKTACRSPRILHLATHGFFLPDQQRDLDRESRNLGFNFGAFLGAKDGFDRLSGPMMENPMLRSGLALAGANTWLKGATPPESAEDGLLTAEDVSGLDLLSTELVVLSACETGLGQIQVGEGVFGLRRAFVLAGAKTLVMSLWKVPDAQTQELMIEFYQRLMSGEGRAEALRQAQLTMKAKHPDPFFWGAFICQGDPSPLPTTGA
jgi:tetratricopeptide (TPR) repeat protein